VTLCEARNCPVLSRSGVTTTLAQKANRLSAFASLSSSKPSLFRGLLQFQGGLPRLQPLMYKILRSVADDLFGAIPLIRSALHSR